MLTREEIKELERLVDKIIEAREFSDEKVGCSLCLGELKRRSVYRVNEWYVCEECAGKVEVSMQDDIRGDSKHNRWAYSPEGRIEGALR